MNKYKWCALCQKYTLHYDINEKSTGYIWKCFECGCYDKKYIEV